MTKHDLYLHEEVLLLALKDREGTIAMGTSYEYAIGAALLTEMLFSGRIRVDKSKKKLVEVVDETRLGHVLLDQAFKQIKSAKRKTALSEWVQKFVMIRELKHRIARDLCRRKILRADEDKVLLFFTRKVYPEVDPKPEQAIIDRLHHAIFTDDEDLDPRTVALLSLANSCSLLNVVFPRRRLRGRKDRIAKVVSGEIIDSAAKDAVAAAQTAVTMAAITAAVITPTITSN